jgi:signal transduction histidine kinase
MRSGRHEPDSASTEQRIWRRARPPDFGATILPRMSDACVALDRDDRYTYLNEQAALILQRSVDGLLGKHIWTIFPETVGSAFFLAYQRARETQDAVSVENYFPPWKRWFESRIYPSPEGVSVLFHDITERKRSELLLIGQTQLLELIAHGATLSTVLTELIGFLEGQSDGARCSILLLDCDGLRLRHAAAPSLPESFTEAVDGVLIGPHAGSCGTAAFTGKPVITEDIATDANWVDWRQLALPLGLRACWSTPIVDERGKVLGTFAMYYEEPTIPEARDRSIVAVATHIAAIAITRDRADAQRRDQERIREKNRELEENNRAAQEANRLKSEFLASMSHELRTPLNAIIGFSEFLVDETPGPINTKQHECLNHVLTSGRHLLRLIGDVLDLAKIEAGKLESYPVEFRLRDELDEVCSIASALAQEKHISVRLECDPALDLVTLDAQKLKQVLFNLLANAVKFTNPGGSIELSARALNAEQLELCVRDNGIGIRPEDLPKLFQEFRQLERGVGRHEGTGLGLVLAKRLVETQHGRIAVESTPGRGSVFCVVLPRVLPDHQPGP